MSISVSSEYTRSYVEVKPHLARPFVGIYLDLENYLNYCAIVLVTYDFLLTLGREIWHVWRARQSFATLLFYGIRYPALFNVVLTLLIRMSWPSFQNSWLWYLGACPDGPGHHHPRQQYYFRCSTRVRHVQPWMVAILPCASIWLAKPSNIYLHFQTNIDDARRLSKPRAASVMSDGIVLALTVVKTYKKIHRPDEAADLAPSLSQILLRDTVLCFSLLCVVNVIGMATGHLTQFIAIWQTWTAAPA
ncbi:hypothetical protein DAEQUDRAFT_507570 [Daedalea quercina L-15889]|uniref:DUF6533 domain-containing protein n=1 Tax=Daedalea quercina L-15889 TaxID=1314783 RepID=A0A165T9N4_9APHY|nr:hypothetical protein DAEQUDRAFT_507570 [Daedalea quercina L-15889]